MRLVIMIIGSLLLSACSQPKRPIAIQKVSLPAYSFAGQYYPNQSPHCAGRVASKYGYIQWVLATTPDSTQETTRYYNQQTGLLLRKTNKQESMWNLRARPMMKRTLSVMPLNEASRLRLLCNKPVSNEARSVIIVSTFVAKPRADAP